MSRISGCFAALGRRGRKALIPFITAGDPEPGVTAPLLHALVEAGADLVEVGVPFSDPMADGPVIQAACERALAHHMSLRGVLELVAQFRQRDQDTPVILMGYLNPIEIMGCEVFAKAAAEAGVDGVITVDLPPEESAEMVAALRKHQLDPIFLLAPTSTEARIRKICEVASGFLYYVSFKGVTGAKRLDVDAVAEKLQQVRRHTDLPVGVGFGIRDPESAAQVAAVADAVVVGSVLVGEMAKLARHPERIGPVVSGLLTAMREAMDAGVAAGVQQGRG